MLLLKNLISQLQKMIWKSLKQANLVNKSDFGNKLISFNKKITSSKTKYLEILKKIK